MLKISHEANLEAKDPHAESSGPTPMERDCPVQYTSKVFTAARLRLP